MNDALQLKLVEILGQIQAATKTAGDFALEQLPDIALQYVAYGRAMHTTGLAFGVLLALTILAVTVVRRKNLSEIPMWVIPTYLIGIPVAIKFIANNFGPAMLVWFAPKVWLLKELAGMLK